ncbi:MAG: hypothetical protein HY776_00515 [Actinobacteria bacterium]|nr:hypothetical protein [Actinomycetota bacterium]
MLHKGKRQGNLFQVDKNPIRTIPIKQINQQNEKRFTILINKIYETKKSDSKADISEYEKEIDQMVYKLYNLTPEEIAITEKSYEK